MKIATRFVCGALTGVVLGYALVLLVNKGAPKRGTVPMAKYESKIRLSEEPEAAEETAVS